MGFVAKVRRMVVEALGGSLLGDRGVVGQDEDMVGFRTISERARGKRTRDLTMLAHKEMIDVALLLYSSNGLAQWLVDMPVDLVVGQELGYSISINAQLAEMTEDQAAEKTREIRAALDKFWYHPAHNVSEKAPEYARTFLVTAHLVLPITAVNDIDGTPQLDLVDAAQIKGVDRKNGSAIVPGLVRFTPDGAGLAEKEQAYVVIQRSTDDGTMAPKVPNADGTIEVEAEDVPAGVKVVGECLYFRYNKLLNSLRGTSYLMPVADWLDALDQFTWTTLDRAKLRNAIVWHLKMNGVQEGRLQEETNKIMAALARPGSTYASNNEVDLEAKAANLGTAENVELGRWILTYILGSKGFPESWYSNGGDANRATAGEQTDVAYKALLSLQTRLRSIFRTMLWVAYDSAQAKHPAVFPKRSESPWLTISPDMPLIQERDISRMAASCAQLASGLEAAIAGKLISERSSRRTFLDVMGKATGGAYELDAEEAQIKSEQEQGGKRDADEAAAARERLQKQLADEGAPVPPPPPGKPGAEPDGEEDADAGDAAA